MSYSMQTGRTNAYLNQRSPYPHAEIEMVTDDLMMIYIVVPVGDRHVDSTAWALGHLVDAVALAIEEHTGNPFASFVTVFSAAWSFISARKSCKRKESAGILALPPFLGASHDADLE